MKNQMHESGDRNSTATLFTLDCRTAEKTAYAELQNCEFPSVSSYHSI